MDCHLDAALRQVFGKVTSNYNFVSFTAVLDSLDKEHAEILRRSCLWPLYSLQSVLFSRQLIDSLLCRLLKPVDRDALHFDLGGNAAIFSILEFAHKMISDAYKWFHNITTSGAWLADNHIDFAMDLLRDRAERHPRSFNIPGLLILNTEFIHAVDIEYQTFQTMGNEYTVLHT
ncbi:uncharacterized protein LOC111388998 [Olea europaea var. sylvestris]|uniref:uncharacterized protein LOC111388998 n=1 Tax=Olea europaea var. sylvestris TaxID=158386 RepID=UPI000C1D1234|nr:uncharacterized protein LOC111388998 [Olea europaea var. sylvestris]